MLFPLEITSSILQEAELKQRESVFIAGKHAQAHICAYNCTGEHYFEDLQQHYIKNIKEFLSEKSIVKHL